MDAFDWRTTMDLDMPHRPDPVPMPGVRQLADNAIDRFHFHAARDERDMAIYWSGQAMAYARVLRDVLEIPGSDQLVNAITAMVDRYKRHRT